MSELITDEIFTDGQKNINAANMNGIVGNARVQPDIIANKPVAATLDVADQMLILKTDNTLARGRFDTIVNSTASSMTLASTTQNGTLRQISGLTTDFVDGTNHCRDAATTVLTPNCITTSMIVDGAINQFKILDGQVVASKIPANQITSTHIYPNTIQNSNLAAGVAQANLGFLPISGNGGNYSNGIPLALSHDTGIGANSYFMAPFVIKSVTGAGRAGIGLSNTGFNGAYLYLQTDNKMHFIDQAGVDHVITSS